MVTFHKLVLVMASITVVAFTLFGFCHSFGGWNSYRIAQAFSAVVGNGLYDSPDVGPIMDNPYGPVSYLLIMPLYLAGSGGPLLVSIGAVMITWLVALTPMAVLLWRLPAGVESKWQLSFAVGALMLVYSVRSCSVIFTSLTAEAPALGFSLLGVILLGFKRQGRGVVLTAGFLMALGIWSKQTAVFLVPFVVLMVAGLDGWRRAWVLSLALVGWCVTLLAVFSLLFDARLMWQNMFAMVGSHPWARAVWPDTLVAWVPGDGAARPAEKLKAVMVVAGILLARQWLLLGFCITSAAVLCRQREKPLYRTCLLLLSSTIGLFAAACIGRVKAGANNNQEALFEYPLILTAISFLAVLISRAWCEWRPDKTDSCASQFIPAMWLMLLTTVLVPRLISSRQYLDLAAQRDDAIVYQYSRASPGVVAFPWNPLGVLLAEGKFTTFEYGVFDKNIGGQQISGERLTQALPNGGRILAYPHSVQQWGHIVNDYSGWEHDPKGIQELPGFTIYRRIEGVNVERRNWLSEDRRNSTSSGQ